MTDPTSEPRVSTRFYALDCVRAAAILLGVFYHAIMFGMFSRGGPPGPAMFGGPAMKAQEWMHSFRMPLFFLISGFFGRMMFEKYGARGYLLRRWSRIGLPLLVCLFTIIPLFQATRGGPMGGGGGGGMGRPPGASGPRREGPPPSSMGEMPSPPPGFTPGGPPPGRGFGPPGGPGFGGGGGGPPMMFGGQPGGLGERIFGRFSYLFKLEYLWFLWYLLVLATAAPLITTVAGWVLLRPGDGVVDRVGRTSLRWGLAPTVLGLVGGAVLMQLPSMFGWSLPLASGIFRSVPDFALRLEPDMAFYLVYFLAGWWLHRVRDELPDVARLWLPFLVVGLACHVGSSVMSTTYGMQRDLSNYAWIRVVGYLVYGVGSAYTAFGFLAFFQRFIDRPSRVGRYLADTAFWVYVVHEPIMTPFLKWVGPWQLPWWLQGLVITALTSASALLLYEAIVKRTFLVRLFGPGGASGPRRDLEST